jgi:hypothetical protein
MARLLSLPYVAAVSSALSCFVSMTNKMASLVGTMDDPNLFPVIVGFLEDDALVEMALPLVGNLSVGHARNIETPIECHLLDLLTKLIPEEKHAADVHWVLLNLVHSVPHLMIGFFGERFVRNTLARAKDAGFEVKKELGFFLATLIVFAEIDHYHEVTLAYASPLLFDSPGFYLYRYADSAVVLIGGLSALGDHKISAAISHNLYPEFVKFNPVTAHWHERHNRTFFSGRSSGSRSDRPTLTLHFQKARDSGQIDFLTQFFLQFV